MAVASSSMALTPIHSLPAPRSASSLSSDGADSACADCADRDCDSLASSTDSASSSPSSSPAPAAQIAAPRPPALAPLGRRNSLGSGPGKPNFQRLLRLSGKSSEQVAAMLGLDHRAMHNLLNHRVTAVERWAPVFAKCVLMSRRGLLKLLRFEKSEIEAESVGETVYQSLLRRGEATLKQCQDALAEGWAGWETYRLSPAEIEAFFAGRCKEAEQVADFLLKLGQATDITNLFAIFTR